MKRRTILKRCVEVGAGRSKQKVITPRKCIHGNGLIHRPSRPKLAQRFDDICISRPNNARKSLVLLNDELQYLLESRYIELIVHRYDIISFFNFVHNIRNYYFSNVKIEKIWKKITILPKKLLGRNWRRKANPLINFLTSNPQFSLSVHSFQFH